MKFTPTKIPAVILIELRVFRDRRGFFVETYHAGKYREGGITETFVQDNSSQSVKGTLRGLHAQLTQPQGKLVRVPEGEIFDVAVDVRVGSPTFGRWVGETLSSENFRQLYIPPGFVHGYCVLSERAQIEYKCTDLYAPHDEIGVIYDDPDLAIDWPLAGEPVLSDKDKAYPRLSEIKEKLPKYAGCKSAFSS